MNMRSFANCSQMVCDASWWSANSGWQRVCACERQAASNTVQLTEAKRKNVCGLSIASHDTAYSKKAEPGRALAKAVCRFTDAGSLWLCQSRIPMQAARTMDGPCIRSSIEYAARTIGVAHYCFCGCRSLPEALTFAAKFHSF